LEGLDLSDCPVTNDALREVSKLRNLKSLWLARTQISDTGIAHLGGLRQIDYLDLSHTALTDEGLMAFRGSRSLHGIWAEKTKATIAGVDRLREHAPNLAVSFSGRGEDHW
jgi:hypothetical protein